MTRATIYHRLSTTVLLLRRLSHSSIEASFYTRLFSSCTITVASAPTSSSTFPTPSTVDDGFYTCSSMPLLYRCPLPLPSPCEAPSFFIAAKPSSAFSLTLALGTPSQQLSLFLDTRNHLTWVPCTSSYQCRSCSSPSATPVIPFLPKSSFSTHLVSCHNPRCLWIHPWDRLSRCPSCNSTSPMAALSFLAHLMPSSMSLAPLSISSCWKHSPSPIGPSPTSRSVAPSFPNASRLVLLDSVATLPPSLHRWGSSASPHSFAEGSSSSATDLLLPATQTKKGIATVSARRCLLCHCCNPRSRRLCLGMIILSQQSLPLTPVTSAVSSSYC
ncbi:hypothetical protein BHM03_00031043 [Ensete ventricosum]|nr:hypothetical protein BHM03_00031043 [Ensete ventricosum]